MVHYIRFLKPPRFDQATKSPKRTVLTALITVTTDLGDAFYPGDLSVFIGLVNQSGSTALGLAAWKTGMRCLKVEVTVPLSYLASHCKLLFTCDDSFRADSLQLGKIPHVISAWTEDFTGQKAALDDAVIRRFALPGGRILNIREDNGESIARHIWDGAVALAAWLLSHDDKVRRSNKKQYSILELGTGCGMIGLVLASMNQGQKCRLILTDLDDECLSLATTNAERSQDSPARVWQCQALDWTEVQKFTLDECLTFVVASECIYNVDNIPSLVNTISTLVRRSDELPRASATPRIIVSTKRRHPSEEVFYRLMSEAGFKQTDRDTIHMPDRYRESAGQELDIVHVHLFEMHAEKSSGGHCLDTLRN